MATTLQAQWNATYGATPVEAQVDQSATFFMQRVAMAMVTAAIAVANEGPGVTNHVNRSALATKILAAPLLWMAPFAQAVAALGHDQSSLDPVLNADMGALWNAFAGGT